MLDISDSLSPHRRGKSSLLPFTRPEGNDRGYGFGFKVSQHGGARSFGHGGGAPGMNGMLTIFPDSRQVVVVLSNFDPPTATRMSDWLTARMPLH